MAQLSLSTPPRFSRIPKKGHPMTANRFWQKCMEPGRSTPINPGRMRLSPGSQMEAATCLEGHRKAGAAVIDGTEVIWASALPPGTSAQRAELIALTQALKKAEGKKANIYTDSQYAFATAHVHGEIYRRRGLLTSKGKEK